MNLSKFILIKSEIFTFSKNLSFNFKGFLENLCNISLHLSACDFKRIISLTIFLSSINFFSLSKSFKIKKIVFSGVPNSCAAAALKEPTSVIFFDLESEVLI